MKRNVCAGVLAALIVIGGSLALASGPPKLDPGLQPYQPTSGVSGNINSIGSDSLNNVMTLWAETFSKFYPNAKVQIEGKGSSTAPPALIAGTAQLGPMSRAMKGTEIDQFEKKYGYKPTQIRTSVDALGVFVNKDNPIKCLTIPQADAIFSKSRRQGYKEDITTWGQLGLTGEWAAKPISLYGRNSASGTYGYFKEHTLKNGDYKDTVKEQPGSASVVQGVTVDRFAVGYSGIGYATAGVRPVPLTEKEAVFPEGGDRGDRRPAKPGRRRASHRSLSAQGNECYRPGPGDDESRRKSWARSSKWPPPSRLSGAASRVRRLARALSLAPEPAAGSSSTGSPRDSSSSAASSSSPRSWPSCWSSPSRSIHSSRPRPRRRPAATPRRRRPSPPAVTPSASTSIARSGSSSPGPGR